MILTETDLAGAFVIDVERHEDRRGYFSRVFCVEELSAPGLETSIRQANLSYNCKAGTLRGLHFQYPPYAEEKYVRCVRGAVLDVIVDLRPESNTYLRHVSVKLSAENGRGLYIPKRFAHGFITLADDTELLYFMSTSHMAGGEGGIGYQDPLLGISWPAVSVISERDEAWAPLKGREAEMRARMSTPASSEPAHSLIPMAD
ncbi:dTDP-4-dehydrorhamnose 3,5-epimerase family protein [Tardiphaga sp. 813_E8_N1_3]|uniref:dTDP-4-dehydrorhamnose 3,5-epimerase family protein n=1 Tax=Tardiphaga sp. 813_E8_N1_3 TaxID=3240760 RepID=UPI003F26D470